MILIFCCEKYPTLFLMNPRIKMNKKTPLYIYMAPDQDKMRRMHENCVDAPKWFAYPISKAGFDIHFANTSKIKDIINANSQSCMLVFNVSMAETVGAIRFWRKTSICSLSNGNH